MNEYKINIKQISNKYEQINQCLANNAAKLNLNEDEQRDRVVDLGKRLIKPLCCANQPRLSIEKELNENKLFQICKNSLIKSINELAFDSYHHLKDSKLNLFYSPLSLYYLLKLFHVCESSDEVKSELSGILNLNADTQIDKTFETLIKSLTKFNIRKSSLNADNDSNLFMFKNNAISRENYLLDSLIDLLKSNFNFNLNLNFDELIAKHKSLTSEYRLVDEAKTFSLNNSLFMILSSQIDLSFEWKTSFNYAKQKKIFNTAHDKLAKLELMRIDKFKFMYAKRPKGLPLRLCQYPFLNENFVFNILLPEKDCFNEVESKLNYDLFSEILEEMKPTDTCTILPKFSIQDKFDVLKLLKDLGAGSLCDFDNLNDGLGIDKAFYKSRLDVDCNSVKAACETNFILGRSKDESREFEHLDSLDGFDSRNPFIFAIRNLNTKLILFMGKFMVPEFVS